MRPAGFEPTIPAGDRRQTYALDRAATGTGNRLTDRVKYRKDNMLVAVNDIEIIRSWYRE